jgi:sulfoxide reductase heme-binding subunit YedZ
MGMMTSLRIPFAFPPALALWRDRQGAFSWPRAAALAIAILPALWFFGRIGLNDLGARPLTAAIHFSGLWTVRLLTATLAVTPLITALRQPRLVPMRRILGVAVFAWILVHFILFIADKSWDPAVVVQEIIKRIYLMIGFAALLMLAALAATSTDAAISRLGAARWKNLHLLIYAIALLGLVHFFMQSKADVTEPTIMAGLIVWLVTMRQPKRFGWTLSPFVILACGIVAAFVTACGEALYFHIKTGADFADVFDADLDFSDAIRPCWWPLAASLAFSLFVALHRWMKSRGKSAPLVTRLRDALT